MRNIPFFHSKNNENYSRFEKNNVIGNFYDNKIQNQKKIKVLNGNNGIGIINLFFFFSYVYFIFFFLTRIIKICINIYDNFFKLMYFISFFLTKMFKKIFYVISFLWSYLITILNNNDYFLNEEKKKKIFNEIIKEFIDILNEGKFNLIFENKNLNNQLKNPISTENENYLKIIKILNELNSEIKIMKKEIENLTKENLKIQNDLKIKKDNEINMNKHLEIVKESITIINKNDLKNNIENIVEDSLHKQKKQHELKLKLFSGEKYGRVGLKNIGNTCYINSVLQILKNIPKFTYNFSKLNNTSDKFLNSLNNLLINICKATNYPFTPNEFKECLGLENKKFSGNAQFDSTIFYISLLNIIDKKLYQAKKDNYQKIDMKKYEKISLQERFEIWKNNYLSKHQSFIYEFFYIYYVSEFGCNHCSNKTQQIFQAMNFLDFPIMNEKGPIKNLKECFENFQMKKNLDDDKCYKCNNVKLYQQFILLELPPVLIINLKRVGEKNVYNNDIEIPLQLNMKEIIKNFKNNSIYELRGYIKHLGDEKSGHNYAICKNMFDDKWYEYNDSICNPCEPNLQRIFFLCYIKIGSDVENIEYLKKIVDLLNKKKDL